MIDNEEEKTKEQASSLLPTINTSDLNEESIKIINQLVAEKNEDKARQLTNLFNLNQRKKAMVRANKLNELLDTITDQTIERFSKKPDEVTNQELIQSLKVVRDSLERDQKQISEVDSSPLIQINQQNNELNVGSIENTPRASRENVKNAVASILAGLTKTVKTPKSEAETEEIIIDADSKETTLEETTNE